MKRNILIKIIVLILIFSSFTSIFLITFLRNSYSEEKLKELKNYVDLFKKTQIIDNYDIMHQNFFEYNQTKDHIRLTIISTTGEVLFDTDEDYRYMENHSNRNEVINALNEGTGVESRFSNTLRKEMLYYAEMYSTEKGEVIVRAAIPISSIYYFIRNIFQNYIIIILLGIIMAVLLSFNIIYKLEYNYKKLNDAISRIENGYYGEKLITQDEDFKNIVNNFNEMSTKINRKIENLEFENNSLNSIFKSIEDGVIVLDEDKKTIYNNGSINRILDYNGKIEGIRIIDIIRNYELNIFLELFYNKPKLDYTEIQYGEKILKITINELIGYSNRFRTGAVLIIQDITEIRKLEQIRSDFVSNVTHELKTPLTSIKGFIETLKDSNNIDRTTELKFYNIIELETDRLTDLINDMLTLSEIETTAGVPGNFNVEDVLKECLELLNKTAKGKNISLEFNKSEKNIFLNGDRNRFKQMLINLIENGIKYNNPGGFVRIDYFERLDKLIISIKDNGIGIDEKDKDRLFERFYRGDKSRNRDRGGTGLGLAIVKHIVKSFNGKIDIESKINVGTTFTIEIPIV